MTIYFISNEGHNLKISAFRSHFYPTTMKNCYSHISFYSFFWIPLSLYLSISPYFSLILLFFLSPSHTISLSSFLSFSLPYSISLSLLHPLIFSLLFFSLSHPHSLIFSNYLALFYHLQSPGHFIEMIPQFPLSLVLIRDKMACGIFECDQIANSYPSNQ